MTDFIFPNNLTILLEPTGACNLRCKHCYHAKTEFDTNKMTEKTLNRFLTITSPFYQNVKIIWHGGEPLLMGYDFYAYAYKAFREFTDNYGTKFNFSVQTNGTLLDEKFVELFEKTNTAISISYDGKYNNALREETEKVESAIDYLKVQNIKFSCLSVISHANIKYLVEMYEEFKEKNIPVKFNPIIPDGAAKENKNYLITKEEWTSCFSEFFKYWFFDDKCNIYLETCCGILAKYLGFQGGCLSGTCLFHYLAVDSYGNLYPCGRLVDKNFLLTNIFDIEDIRQSYLSEKYSEILNSNTLRANNCKMCKWFSKCHSGCNASAILSGELKKPFEFDCYFIRQIFITIENVLENYDISKINPYAREILQRKKCNFK